MKAEQPLPDPKEPLKNVRHELFCGYLLQGMSQEDAYKRAGYSAKGARDTASRLSTNVNVINRLKYLKERATEGSIMTRQRAMQILSEIAEADLSDFLTVDMDGVQHFKFDKQTMKRKALKKVKTRTTRDEHGNIVMETMFNEMELESKVQALERLSKMMGWDQAQKMEVTSNVMKVVFEELTTNAATEPKRIEGEAPQGPA